jgi:ParB family chromosome partitioning protein
VLEPVIVAKDGDQAVVLDGRQRVKAAREANRRLVEQGVDPLRVPCVLRRGDDSDMFAVMVSANEHRATESPVEKARKVQRYINLGHTEEEAATLWGVSRMTIRNWLATLDLAPKVQKAIEDGRISPSAALPLGKLPRDEQAARLDEMTAGDRKPTVREARERTGTDRPKIRSRRELEGALGAVRKGGVPARVLAWVLGQSDDAERMEG